MKSACKNTESGIAFWVICCNWFSCTNLNMLQTVLVSVGRVVTTGEEQPSSLVYFAGKVYLRPNEAAGTRRGRAEAAAVPLGSGPQSPRMALEPAEPAGSEGKSELGSCPCPLPHLQSLAWGISSCLQSSPAAGRSFAASWCLHSSQTLQGFVFLFPFLYPNAFLSQHPTATYTLFFSFFASPLSHFGLWL